MIPSGSPTGRDASATLPEGGQRPRSTTPRTVGAAEHDDLLPWTDAELDRLVRFAKRAGWRP